MKLTHSRFSSSFRPHKQCCFRHLTLTTNHHHHYQHHQNHETVASSSSFSLLAFCTNISSLKKIHALLIKEGLSTHHSLCQTKLASLYVSFGYLRLARFLFDTIRNPDFFSWKVMIRCYFYNHLYVHVLRFYARMVKCLNEFDNVVFSIVLKACTELRDLGVGIKVHSHILKVGNPDSFLLTCLVDMYAKCGVIQWSRYVFDNTDERDVVCWTSMLAGYVQNNCPREGLILFDRMREARVQGNQFTLGSLITACTKLGALHQGKWVHGLIIKNGVSFNSFLITALVDVYVKCGDIRDARSVFDELCIAVDVVSWTAMIAGYTQSGNPVEALKLFVDKKKRQSLLPNSFTAATVLSACGQSENLNMGRSMHGLGITTGIEDASVKNALVDMYAKCHKIEDARFIFDNISSKDLIAWNTILTGYSQNGFAYKAFELFHIMRLDNLSSDAVTFVSIISACAALGSLPMGASLHAFVLKEGLLSSNVYVGTALLNFYAKCGDVKSARVVFDDMGEKNTITWSAMVSGYGIQGDSTVSLSLFGDMANENMKPNEAIFTAILSACSHTGMVGEGWKYFNAMCRDYKFVPSMKHYACMVDLLSRSGRLEEALDFIEKMPIQPEVSVFGAFLHGCSLHSRFDLAETAVKRMKELHPGEACYYVLLSNLYASEGRWSQADEARGLMKQKHLSKSPGHSLVELDVSSNSFNKPLMVLF